METISWFPSREPIPAHMEKITIMKFMAMLVGMTLLSAPTMFAGTKKDGKAVEKNPEAAKAAQAGKAQKAKTQSAVREQPVAKEKTQK